jgi:transaldolase
MKIFLDTANRDLIKKWSGFGIVDGVTTNPSLLSKEGSSPKEVLLDICNMVSGDVSIEVVTKTPEEVYEQAHAIAKIAPNVVVKIPCLTEYLPVIHRLVQESVQINVTLVFSAMQALLVAKLGVKYISPFIGRLDDISQDGIALIEEIVQLKANYEFDSEVLAASIRHLMHWKSVALAGADIATVPPALIEQAMKHPLTDKGVELFDNDWKKVGKTNLLG